MHMWHPTLGIPCNTYIIMYAAETIHVIYTRVVAFWGKNNVGFDDDDDDDE